MSSIITVKVPYTTEGAFTVAKGGIWFHKSLHNWLLENTNGFTNDRTLSGPNTWTHDRGDLDDNDRRNDHLFMFNDPEVAMRFKLTWA
jgi:hypothetical protein